MVAHAAVLQDLPCGDELGFIIREEVADAAQTVGIVFCRKREKRARLPTSALLFMVISPK